MKSPSLLGHHGLDRCDLTVDRQRLAGKEGAGVGEERRRAVWVFELATALHRRHLRRRVLVEPNHLGRETAKRASGERRLLGDSRAFAL